MAIIMVVAIAIIMVTTILIGNINVRVNIIVGDDGAADEEYGITFGQRMLVMLMLVRRGTKTVCRRNAGVGFKRGKPTR